MGGGGGGGGGQRGHVPPLGRSGRRCDMSMDMWLLCLHYNILLVQKLFQNKIECVH